MIYYAGRVVPGFALGDDPSARFQTALNEILNGMERFAKTLTPREKAILEIGLTASHLEESAAHGDWTRARAHAENLTKVLAGL